MCAHQYSGHCTFQPQSVNVRKIITSPEIRHYLFFEVEVCVKRQYSEGTILIRSIFSKNGEVTQMYQVKSGSNYDGMVENKLPAYYLFKYSHWSEGQHLIHRQLMTSQVIISV